MAAPFVKLPPGVYFNPTAEECVRDYLRPWQAGVRPATDRIIDDVYIYGDNPAALLLGREPGFSRGAEHKWLLLTHSTRVCGGKGRKARAKRDVDTGGNWKVEQRSKGVPAADKEDDGGDRRRTNGFYLPGVGGNEEGKKVPGVKTPWLMEEITTEEDEAASVAGWKGDRTIKVLCKIYVSPRASNEEKLAIFGEDGVPFDRDGKPKIVREAIPEDLFDAVVASFYQAKGKAPAPPPPAPAPPRVLGQPARRVVGHQHGRPAALPPPAPRVLGLQQGVPGNHQYGQAAATPAILGHHHGHAVLPQGVPAHHQHGHGQAAPRQIHHGGPGQHYGGSGQFYGAPGQFYGAPGQFYGGSGQFYGAPGQFYGGAVHDPYRQFHEASPGVAGNFNSAMSFAHFDPRQQQQQQGYDYETIHTEKKPRLTLTHESPPQDQQPQGDSDSDKSSCVVQSSAPQEQGGQCGDMDADAKVFQEAAPVPPPQEVPGTGAVQPEFADDTSMVAVESMSDFDIFANLAPLTQESLLSDDKPDLLMSKPPCNDDELSPQPGFVFFDLEDLMNGPDFLTVAQTPGLK